MSQTDERRKMIVQDMIRNLTKKSVRKTHQTLEAGRTKTTRNWTPGSEKPIVGMRTVCFHRDHRAVRGPDQRPKRFHS